MQRLPRILLWLLIIGFPVLYCVLVIVSDFIDVFLFFYPSPESYINNATEGSPSLWLYYSRLVILGAFRLHPLWLAFISCAVLFLLISFTARVTGRRHLLRRPSSAVHLAGQLVALILLAYIVGSLVHFVTSPWLIDYSSFPSSTEYWWPVPSSVELGWTIYPPFGGIVPMSPWAQGACFKLGTLLALLTIRYVWLRRSRTLLQPSQLYKQ